MPQTFDFRLLDFRLADVRSVTRAAPIVALALGAAAALSMAVLPEWRLEAFVAATGLGEVLSAARPPLGATARSALALVTGAAIAGVAYAAVLLAARLLSARTDGAVDRDVPVLRRADAHPDAPARRPLRASEELGQPLAIASPTEPAVVVERDLAPPRALPVDLETPLAAVDPGAIPSVPLQPVRAVAALASPAPSDAGDRVEAFELTPLRRSPASKPETKAESAKPELAQSPEVAPLYPARRRQPAPAATSTKPASLSALLDRLERGAAQIDGRPTPSVDEAIGLLRGLAAR